MLTIEKLPKPELNQLISTKVSPKLTFDGMVMFEHCIKASTIIWQAHNNGKVMCVWGLIPPTLMHTAAYLWLHIVEPIGEYEFLLVRHSQRAVVEALKEFPAIVGHCAVDNARAIRWIEWLGGKFGFPSDGLVPFIITAKEA